MEVTSNWSTENNVKLIDVIQESNNFPTGDFVELLDEEKCVSISRPATDVEECYIRLASRSGPASVRQIQGFNSKNKKLIMGFMLLSEARVIEVFTGSHDEYCMTVHGKLMGDFEDSKLYKCEVQLDKPKNTVKLQLKATFHVNSLWVYGFHVMISVEPAIQPSTRFGSDHLSLVLKDKDVQMSKQATKFRQMLENFNSVSDASNPYVGNNPMALMSIMLGPMMSSRSSVSSTETDGKHEILSKKAYSSCNDNGHTVKTQDNIKGCELKNSIDLFAIGQCLGANIQEETQRNLENEIKKQCNLENEIKNFVIDCDNRKYQENKMSDQSCAENGVKSKGSSLYRDNLVEKLHTLITDGNKMMVDQQKFCPLMDIVFKAGTSTSKAMMHSAKGYFNKSSGTTNQTASNPLQPAVDSSIKLPTMNMDQHVKLSPNDCSDSNKAWETTGEVNRAWETTGEVNRAWETTGEVNRAWETTGEAGSADLSTTVHQDIAGTRNSTENNESLLNCIESLIDKKLAALEERMLQKIEQKLSEKTQIDTLNLKKIEELLSKLHDKL